MAPKLPQKRYLLDFVFSNVVLEGNRLVFTLKGPFETLASFNKSQNWLPIPELLLSKYYRVIREIALEVELASSYLGSSAEFSGRVKPLIAGLKA